MRKTVRQTKGMMGEMCAELWMKRQGFSVLQKNWRSGNYEIDLICSNGKIMVFVEVRSQFSATKSFPESSILLLKQTSVQKASRKYLAENRVQLPVRQDVVGVRFSPWGKQLLHIPDAFH
ncbi:MAG: YraN family protein [Bacteroidota bacterium]|jgi:putative endonuclease